MKSPNKTNCWWDDTLSITVFVGRIDRLPEEPPYTGPVNRSFDVLWCLSQRVNEHAAKLRAISDTIMFVLCHCNAVRLQACKTLNRNGNRHNAVFNIPVLFAQADCANSFCRMNYTMCFDNVIFIVIDPESAGKILTIPYLRFVNIVMVIKILILKCSWLRFFRWRYLKFKTQKRKRRGFPWAHNYQARLPISQHY